MNDDDDLDDALALALIGLDQGGEDEDDDEPARHFAARPAEGFLQATPGLFGLRPVTDATIIQYPNNGAGKRDDPRG